MPPDTKPTIVLVHGAFADASGWSDVIRRLSALGYGAYAPANPLRSVIADGDSVRTFLSTIEGPVVLVGHSYGGSVITNARPPAHSTVARTTWPTTSSSVRIPAHPKATATPTSTLSSFTSSFVQTCRTTWQRSWLSASDP
jgi:hypothetical protein